MATVAHATAMEKSHVLGAMAQAGSTDQWKFTQASLLGDNLYPSPSCSCITMVLNILTAGCLVISSLAPVTARQLLSEQLLHSM